MMALEQRSRSQGIPRTLKGGLSGCSASNPPARASWETRDPGRALAAAAASGSSARAVGIEQHSSATASQAQAAPIGAPLVGFRIANRRRIGDATPDAC